LTEVFGWPSIYGDVQFDQLSVGLRSPLRPTFGFGDAGFYEEALSEPFPDMIRSLDRRQGPIGAVW
jgi:hypothetical protein